MNERFLELAKQLPGWVSTDDGAYIGPHSSALKLYAELIIRECALVVFNKTGPKSALNVLEHFGVKE